MGTRSILLISLRWGLLIAAFWGAVLLNANRSPAEAATTAWCQAEARTLFDERSPAWAIGCLAHERLDRPTGRCVASCGNEVICRQKERIAQRIATGILNDADATLWSEKDFSLATPVVLREFAITNGRLGRSTMHRVPARLKPLQADLGSIRGIFEDFVSLVPPRLAAEIGGYRAVSDGRDGYLAETQLSQGSQPAIITSFDPADVTDLRFTYLHELAHVLALSEHERRVEALQEICPRETTEIFAAARDSYLQSFVRRFWQPMGEKYLALWTTADAAKATRLQQELAQKYGGRFWSDYALTSPVEDFAESFAYFVLMPESLGLKTGIKEQKLRFFAQFPELVRLREALRWNLATLR